MAVRGLGYRWHGRESWVLGAGGRGSLRLAERRPGKGWRMRLHCEAAVELRWANVVQQGAQGGGLEGGKVPEGRAGARGCGRPRLGQLVNASHEPRWCSRGLYGARAHCAWQKE